MSLTNSPFWFSSGATSAGGGPFYPYSIDQSLRFNDNDSAYLTRTPSSNGNRKIWTFSGWIKRANIGLGNTNFFGTGVGGTEAGCHFLSDVLEIYQYSGGYNFQLVTNRKFRDASSWYHIVMAVDTTQSTSSNRVKLYINGVRETSFSTASYPAQNLDTLFNYTSSTNILGNMAGQSTYWDGYMAEYNFIDGTALDATSFGETKNEVWVPKRYSGSYGTNGFYLNFSDNSTATALGTDSSGNGNNFSVNNLATTDQVPDSPTNTFPTLNPLANYASVTFADGNLYHNASGNNKGMLANWILPKSGKWYWEHYSIQFHYPTDNEAHFVGINTQNVNLLDSRGGLPTAITVSSQSGPYDGSSWVLNVRNGSYGSTGWDENEGVGVVYDADAQTIAWKVNGGTTTTPISVPDGDWIPWIGTGGSTGSEQGVFNFGQDGTFGGRTASGNYTDANGYGNFKWQPPTDALALCTANLPEPAIGPNSTTTSDQNFNTVLWTGNGGSLSVTGTNHQPNFVWYKRRDGATNHGLFDSVRGINLLLQSNLTTPEQGVSGVTSFNSDGFTLGGNTDGNASGGSYAGWSWAAGGTAVSNTNGSVASSVSANQDAGFSIVSWTAQAGTYTVGHGLSQKPELIITKNRATSGGPWYTFTTAIDGTLDYLSLDTTAAALNDPFGTALPTASVFSGTNNYFYSSGGMIAYCFHSVEGFSKVGSFTGKGDPTFVYTGFRPAWIMVKNYNTSSHHWVIYDRKRNTYNVINNYLYANLTSAEQTATRVDFVSNGFVGRANNYDIAQSGVGFIYLAFAEQPFKYANAR